MKSTIIEYSDGTKNLMTYFGDDITSNEITNKDVDEVLLILPAMGVRASYYNHFADGLIELGRLVYTIDLRGQGQSSVRASENSDWGYKELIQDLKELVDKLKVSHPKSKLILLGHSLGGQIACLYSAKYKSEIDGIILVAACSIYYKGWKGFQRLGVRVMIGLYFLITKLFGYFPGDKLGFGGREGYTEMLDWCRNARNGTYAISNESFNYDQELAATANRVLAFTLPNDTFAPFAATKNLLDKFNKESSIEHITTDNTLGFDHFSWAKSPQHFKKIIDDWLFVINSSYK